MLKNNIFIISLLIVLSCSFEKHYEKPEKKPGVVDTLFITVNSILDSANNINSSIHLMIINLKVDTLLLIPNPFLLETNFIEQLHTWVLAGHEFTSPNIIYLEDNKDKLIFDSDGEYKFMFKSMPQLILLPPNDTFNIKIKLNKELSFQCTKNGFKFYGAVVYSFKKYADFMAHNSEQGVRSYYFKNQKLLKEIVVQPLTFNEFKENLFFESQKQIDLKFSKFIWDIFRNRVGF